MTTLLDLARDIAPELRDPATFRQAVRRASSPPERYWIRTQLADNLEMLAEAERIWRELDDGSYDDSCLACGGHGCAACSGSGKRAA